ncbi:hypothetical protein GCM10010116_58360 [Microbispora rosea subsp. aerata]|nr:hypothetical protein GCM10010116_58360 [Microbispora rosea subsp. aerata]GIH58823.1 hypothetical protein Mro02_57370 [Microbispora rosea subsp. aerata]GLJ86756.1 hypothetical protein GCM10017588_54960 [Microbispora rosea subsp. aerata]
MLGYQPQKVTTGRSFLGIVFVQLLALFPPSFPAFAAVPPAVLPPPPASGAQAASALAATRTAAVTSILFVFVDMISPSGSQRTGIHAPPLSRAIGRDGARMTRSAPRRRCVGLLM